MADPQRRPVLLGSLEQPDEAGQSDKQSPPEAQAATPRQEALPGAESAQDAAAVRRARHRADRNWRERPPARVRPVDAPITPLRQLPEWRATDDLSLLPPLPQRRRRRKHGTLISFALCVLVPIALATVYYGFYASDQYVADFQFAVREAPTAIPNPGTAMANMASMAGLSGSSSSVSVENYMVAEYLTSRQIVDELQEKLGVKQRYSRPGIDWWARFDPSQPMEQFVTYWQNMASASYDQITGLATAHVRAFTPDDAYLIASTMVSLAEKLVNEISARSRRDAVRFAEEEVTRAKKRLGEVRTQLSAYRDKEAVIDPTTNVVASNTTLAQTLRATLMQYETEVRALQQQKLQPDAPAIVALRSRIFATKQQLAEVESAVASAKEGSRPLSRVVGQYEELVLERDVAQTILTSAVQSLEQARSSAAVQHLYITPFVRPVRPQSAVYPRRFVSILTAALGFFFLWTIGLLVVRSIREHLA